MKVGEDLYCIVSYTRYMMELTKEQVQLYEDKVDVMACAAGCRRVTGEQLAPHYRGHLFYTFTREG